jgi:DNA-binding LacI/PurR family transcriptional regulator
MSERALEIVEHVLAGDAPLSPAELRRKTGIPPASMTRLLGSLRQSGYLTRLSRGQYVPGPRLRALSSGDDSAKGDGARKSFFLVMPPRNTCEELFHGIRGVIEDRDISCAIRPVRGTVASLESDELDDLMERAGGLIFFSERKLPPERAERLAGHRVPCVGVGFPGYDFCDTLTWDQRCGYYRMTSRLIERGSRAIVYLGSERPHAVLQSFMVRVRGYEEAMREHGLQPDVRLVSPSFFSSPEGGRQLARLVEGACGTEPPGILLSDDNKLDALAAMLAAQGFDLHQDVRLCSIYRTWRANDLADVVPRLTLSIVEPWEEVGRAAAQRLMARTEGDDTAAQLILIRPEILEN